MDPALDNSAAAATSIIPRRRTAAATLDIRSGRARPRSETSARTSSWTPWPTRRLPSVDDSRSARPPCSKSRSRSRRAPTCVRCPTSSRNGDARISFGRSTSGAAGTISGVPPEERGRGAAAAATWIFRGLVAAPGRGAAAAGHVDIPWRRVLTTRDRDPDRPCVDGLASVSRRHRGCHKDSLRGLVAAPPRLGTRLFRALATREHDLDRPWVEGVRRKPGRP